MKEFWNENKKTIGKLILNQFGATFLGVMVITASSAAQDYQTWLMLLASCLASIFYLYLVYNVIWERGGQDRIRVDGGRAHRKPLTGLWISLVANIPNFIFAAMVLISNPIRNTYEWAAGLNILGRSLCLLWEGMYAGFVSYFSPHNPIIHLLYIFPAIFITTVGYLIGLNNKRLLAPFELKQPKKKK